MVLVLKILPELARWQATSRGASLWYPIWLAFSTSVLDEAGFETRLIDAPAYDYSLKKTLSEIRSFSPQLCIIDTSTSSIIYDLETARQIKKRLSGSIKICFVGPHASAVPVDVIKEESVDFVTIDEYDFTVRELAQRLAKDLDELPFASKSLFKHFNISKYCLDFTRMAIRLFMREKFRKNTYWRL